MPDRFEDDNLDLVLDMFGTEEDQRKAAEAERKAQADPRGDPSLFTGPLIFESLDEAREFVLRHLEEGVQCPCCGQLARLYKRALNSAMARSLIWLVGESGPNLDWVDVPNTAPKWLLKSRELPKLVHWGLIEEMPKDPLDTSKRTSGWWRPTSKGRQFAKNTIKVPKRVHLYNNAVQRFDPEEISILDALGTKFDYADLITP